MVNNEEPKGLLRLVPKNLTRLESSEIKRCISWAWEKRWPLFLLATVVVTLLVVPLLWQLPERRIGNQYQNIPDLDRAKLVEESRRNLISGISTIATIAGAVVLIANLIDSKARLAHDTAKSAKEYEIAESRLLAERFSKAIELLGREDNESVQLGGIYALEQIAKSSPEYYWTVIEVLTAFIRNKSPLLGDIAYSKHPSIPFLAQAALTSLCRCKNDDIDNKNIIDLGNTNLHYASFATLDGGVDFSFAYFCKSNLRKADFGELHLYSANFQGADLSFADFSGARLRSDTLNGSTSREGVKYPKGYIPQK